MLRHALAALLGAAAFSITGAATTTAHAQEGPQFVEKTFYTSDIQYRFTRAPDNKSLSVLIDNFGVNLFASGDAAPVAIRLFPLSIAVKDAAAGALLSVEASGAIHCSGDAKCPVIVWVNGQTHVMNFTFSRASEVYGKAQFTLPADESLQVAVMLIADREVKQSDLPAAITIDTLDFTIAPPAPAGGDKK